LQSRIAVLEQELARVQKNYDLLLASGQPPSAAPPSVETGITAGPARDLPARSDPAWFIKSARFGVTSGDRFDLQYSWIVTVSNHGGSRPRTFDLEVQYLDTHDVVIESDVLYGQAVGAFAERVFTGSARIRHPGGFQVVTLKVIATSTDGATRAERSWSMPYDRLIPYDRSFPYEPSIPYDRGIPYERLLNYNRKFAGR
jgi:hypothetical protein